MYLNKEIYWIGVDGSQVVWVELVQLWFPSVFKMEVSFFMKKPLRILEICKDILINRWEPTRLAFSRKGSRISMYLVLVTGIPDNRYSA
jgi:hypothetical protein